VWSGKWAQGVTSISSSSKSVDVWVTNVWVMRTTFTIALTSEVAGNIPRLLCRGVGRAQSLQDYISEHGACGQKVVRGWGEVGCPRCPDSLRRLLTVLRSKEIHSRFVNRPVHRMCEENRDVVHL